jgi:hypothetical protein
VPEGASPQARRLAAAILEALAGLRNTAEAAEAAGMSLPRYYLAEARALRGLLAACEPTPRGRRAAAGAGELPGLREENQRLRKQCARQQALLRLQQRALGLEAAPDAAGPQKPGKKRRQPRKRALRLIEGLRRGQDASAAEAGPVEA